MDASQVPDLLIFGDSHTAALDMAIREDGFSTSLLYINGNHWHAGGFVYDEAFGFLKPGSGYMRRRIGKARLEMGGKLFHQDRVVLASVGYHLGRLCPGMGRRGHTVDEAAFDANPEASYLSSAMMEAIVTAQRQGLWDMLAAAAKDCVLVVVAPPILTDDPLQKKVALFITRSLRERGILVWDPREQSGAMGQPLAPELRAADGVHGNAAYGKAVLDMIFPPTEGDEDHSSITVDPAA
jgi:hypothetical protein